MSEFVLYMMLVFLPGIIAYQIFDLLTEHQEYKLHEIIIYAFLFGGISYFVYFIFGNIFSVVIHLIPIYEPKWTFTFHFLDALKNPQNAEYGEILVVSLLSILVGIGITIIKTHRWLYRIAENPLGWLIKSNVWISKKHGELDTFTYLMDATKDSWVIIRDIEDNFAYSGSIYSYSAGHERNELFLTDVIVYDNATGEKIMSSPGIYLSKPKEKYIIELSVSEKCDII